MTSSSSSSLASSDEATLAKMADPSSSSGSSRRSPKKGSGRAGRPLAGQMPPLNVPLKRLCCTPPCLLVMINNSLAISGSGSNSNSKANKPQTTSLVNTSTRSGKGLRGKKQRTTRKSAGCSSEEGTATTTTWADRVTWAISSAPGGRATLAQVYEAIASDKRVLAGRPNWKAAVRSCLSKNEKQLFHKDHQNIWTIIIK